LVASAHVHARPHAHSGPHAHTAGATVLWQPQPQLGPGQGLQAQEFISTLFMAFS
jgi:hypothetical protein